MELHLKATIYLANFGWLIYGVGNTIGSPIFGKISHHFSISKTLVLNFVIAAVSIAILFVFQSPWVGLVSFALNGIVANSFVSLTSSYLSKLAPLHQQTHFWSIFTIAVTISQACGSAIMAHWMSTTHGYEWMIGTCCGAMLLAAIMILCLIKVKYRS